MIKINNIIVELINNNKSLVSALLKTKMLATQIDNNALLLWVERELNGYENYNLPSYRHFKGQVIGTFINGQYKYNNQPISTINMDKELDIQLLLISFNQSIANLEMLIATSASSTLEFKFPSSICKQIESHLKTMGSPNFQLIECKKTVSISVVNEILNRVRIILLDFLLNIDNQFNTTHDWSILKSKNELITQLFTQTMDKNLSDKHAL